MANIKVFSYEGNNGRNLVYEGVAKNIMTPSPYGFKKDSVPITNIWLEDDVLCIGTQVATNEKVIAVKGRHEYPTKHLYLYKEVKS